MSTFVVILDAVLAASALVCRSAPVIQVVCARSRLTSLPPREKDWRRGYPNLLLGQDVGFSYKQAIQGDFAALSLAETHYSINYWLFVLCDRHGTKHFGGIF